MNVSNNVGGGFASINRASSSVTTASERIASGSRINNGRDDAAGLAISNRLTSQITGFGQATRNANDGVSFLQTADSGLASITDGIQRIRELSIQAANGTLSDKDRSFLNAEAQEIKDELTRTVETTQFNNQAVYTNDDDIPLQVGAESGDTLDVSVGNIEQLFEDAGLADIDLSTAAGASDALGALDEVQDGINVSVSEIGAGLNRLDSTIASLSASEIAAESSRSRIKDADLAKEISDLAAGQVKQETAIAIQAQANAQKGIVLKFLEGL